MEDVRVRWLCQGLVLFSLLLGCLVAYATGNAPTESFLAKQSDQMLSRMAPIVGHLRSIAASFLVGGLLWCIAMWASGRPAIKPVITTLFALVVLFGLQMWVTALAPEGTAEELMEHLPEDTLRFVT